MWLVSFYVAIAFSYTRVFYRPCKKNLPYPSPLSCIGPKLCYCAQRGKESEWNLLPHPKNATFILVCTIFDQLWRQKKKAKYRSNHFLCTKTTFLKGCQVTRDYSQYQIGAYFTLSSPLPRLACGPRDLSSNPATGKLVWPNFLKDIFAYVMHYKCNGR